MPVSGPVMRSPWWDDRIEAEQRRQAEKRTPGIGVRGQKAEHQDEAEDAADIAGGPSGAGQPPDSIRRHQRRHHRVVEDGGEFDADARDRIGEQQRRDDAGVTRLSEPHQRGADHQQRAEAGDPRLAAAAGVRNRAQHRRQQRDHQAGGRGGKSPQRLPLRRIRRDEAREIGRKYKGGDQREIRLRGPIEEDPADDGGAARIFPRHFGAGCLGSDHRHVRNFLQKSREAFCPLNTNPYSMRHRRWRLLPSVTQAPTAADFR